MKRRAVWLQVKGYDNDFGDPLERAVKTIWFWVVTNRREYHGIRPLQLKTENEIFVELFENGLLKKMIDRTWFIKTLEKVVEDRTHGLCLPNKYNSPELSELEPINLEYEKYLSCELDLHETDELSEQPENGEHVWLDTETGITKRI